jgi:hypothetical protein
MDAIDLDIEWLQFGLERDAAIVGALTMQGRPEEADAHIAATNYTHRLAALKAARLKLEDP